ncbi:SGNH/GDSL hydrolase family protein [Tengunoibacter tsumagoiensis]|uniref:SGNH hydrolase-type esterase domain-containing protein n=1 Tax=Tengunoibacter tsumagoiensis TaxID=2014871 RepID=A0A402A535_9CHLR|nr:SGNH/GDSL hydrolase family protein [Tengunoibacter tsumagoiensis]GCE14125.1 hypothetical protein KTT_39840 [Tengunoibacter tsumagoiensis]
MHDWFFSTSVIRNQYAVLRQWSVEGTRPRVPTALRYMLPAVILLCTLFIPLTPHSTFPVSSSTHPPLTYVAIGASDTFGVGTDDPLTESWPSDLARQLGNQIHLVNLGIPGLLAHNALTRSLPIALDAHPQLITIWLAVNDLAANVALESYQQDLEQLVAQLQKGLPQARIVLANVPDLTLLPHFKAMDGDVLRKQIDDYNSTIVTLADHHHIVLVDLYQQWKALAQHPEYISDDGFHPSASGYAQLAEIFYNTLQKQAL